MQAPQYRLTVGHIAEGQRDMLLARGLFEKAMQVNTPNGVGSWEAATNTTGTGCS